MANKRLIFSHIPKTAGTSVRLNLKKAFEEFYIDYLEVGVYDMTSWKQKSQHWSKPHEFNKYDVPAEWNFLYGHITIEEILENKCIDQADDKIVLLSFLRDPIDRLISTYNFISAKRDHPLHQKSLEQNTRSFFYELSKAHKNIQYRYLTCPRSCRWQFLVASNRRVGPTCAETFRKVTAADIEQSFFEQRHNVTNRLPGSQGKEASLSRSQFSDSEIQSLYTAHSLDKAMFDLVEQEGVLYTNPAWEV